MKFQLSHSKTEKNYVPNKYILNLKTSRNAFKRKNLEIKSLSNFDEEYIQRFKYQLSEMNLKKNNKNKLFHQELINSKFPSISKNSTMDFSKKGRRKSILLIRNLKEEKTGTSKYEKKLENIYKENILEKKREELEIKINKIKSLMKPLSFELAKTLKKIDNYKLELDIINNFNFSENNLRKIYLSKVKSNNINLKSNDQSNQGSSLNSSTDKNKSKEFDLFIKTEKMKLHNKKLIVNDKLSNFKTKKENILLKYNTCESELKDLKKELNKIKDKLIIHYHKLLFEAKDTRSEGLSWIIRAIWKLKQNVLMSYMPKFLDEKSIEFLFKYSDKLVEIEQIQKNIQEKKFYENEKNNKSNKDDDSIIKTPHKRKRLKTLRKPSALVLRDMRRKSLILTESPIKAIKKLISESPKKFNGKKNNKIMEEKTISEFSEETFKTSLYQTKTSFKDISTKLNNMKQKHNIIFQNLEMMLENPNYLDKLTSHLSPTNNIRIIDYENMKNVKIEDIYDSSLVKIFNEHKNLLLKLKEKKAQTEIFVKNELDRIGKCFCIEDYSGKYNTDLKTVVGALIGVDNSKLEVFRLQKEQKEYFRTIKNLRTFNLLNKKVC